MELPSFNYSIREHNDQFYFEPYKPNQPKQSTLETLEKIERYLTFRWEYSTDPQILAANPNPWAGTDLADRFGALADMLTDNYNLESKGYWVSRKVSKLTSYLSGESEQVKKIAANIKLLVAKKNEVTEAAIITNLMATQIGYCSDPLKADRFLKKFETYLNELQQNKLLPSQACVYVKTGLLSGKLDILKTRQKLTEWRKFPQSDLQPWIITVRNLMKEYIQNGDKERIQFLSYISSTSFFNDENPLTTALKSERPELIEVLLVLEYGTAYHEHHLINDLNASPIRLALMKGYDDIAKKIVHHFESSGIKFCDLDSKKNTLIQHEILLSRIENREPNADFIRKVIALGPHISGLNNRNKDKATALDLNPPEPIKEMLFLAGAWNFPSTKSKLHQACLNDDIKGTENLLQLGANIEAIDGNGYTPLFYACDPEIADLLLKYGADCHRQIEHVLLDVNSETRTPFTYAMHCPEIFKVMLKYQKSSSLRFADGTLLHLAVSSRQALAVEALIEFGADLEAEQFPLNTITPLALALGYYNQIQSDELLSVIRVLLEKGALLPSVVMDIPIDTLRQTYPALDDLLRECLSKKKLPVDFDKLFRL